MARRYSFQSRATTVIPVLVTVIVSPSFTRRVYHEDARPLSGNLMYKISPVLGRSPHWLDLSTTAATYG